MLMMMTMLMIVTIIMMMSSGTEDATSARSDVDRLPRVSTICGAHHGRGDATRDLHQDN